MFDMRKKSPSIVKSGFAALGLVWSIPIILGRLTKLVPETPERYAGQELQFAFGYYLTLFFALAIMLICIRFFYKNFLSIKDD